MGNGVEMILWVGMAGVALGLIQIALWRTRRVLSHARASLLTTEVRLATPAFTVPPAFTKPAAATEMASSVLAS